jgi:hypothetical protein
LEGDPQNPSGGIIIPKDYPFVGIFVNPNGNTTYPKLSCSRDERVKAEGHTRVKVILQVIYSPGDGRVICLAW